MTLTLLTNNLLELTTSAVSVSPAAEASKPLSRVYDRDRSIQYQGGSAAQTDIDIDLGKGYDVSAWSLLTHNATAVTVTLFGNTSTPPFTSRDSFSADGTDIFRTFATLTLRYWRVRIPALAVAPKIGELFLGTIWILPTPEHESEEEMQGNVQRDESPGGYVWKARKGMARNRLIYRWHDMTDANWMILRTAYDETFQGAKAFPLLDFDNAVRWVEFVPDRLRRVRHAADHNEVDVTLQDAL